MSTKEQFDPILGDKVRIRTDTGLWMIVDLPDATNGFNYVASRRDEQGRVWEVEIPRKALSWRDY